MSTFDKVIGYETIKGELMQICDMIHNKDIYTSLGAKLPRGLLLYGDPGLGKTLMAKCFIEESSITAYTIRRNKGADDFVGEITSAFRIAKENAPAIVFLDDMDKFANEEEELCDAPEYVAIQAGIDEVKGCEVFVLGTANNVNKLPPSLIRSGRFDRKIEVCRPTTADSCEIIKYYLKDKKLAEDINLEDIGKMIQYSSCAELETVLNEAAIIAGYNRRDNITMKDMIEGVLRMEYHAPDNLTKPSTEELNRIALHEAGHVVVCEVLCPDSVGLASLRSNGRSSVGGFVRRCKEFTHRSYDILVSLAGKAATEMYYSDLHSCGCISDIHRASDHIRDAITENAVCGFANMEFSIISTSESLRSRIEALASAEMERYYFKVKDILIKNKAFLEKVTAALIEKETLLYSDIKAIKESVEVIEVAV